MALDIRQTSSSTPNRTLASAPESSSPCYHYNHPNDYFFDQFDGGRQVIWPDKALFHKPPLQPLCNQLLLSVNVSALLE